MGEKPAVPLAASRTRGGDLDPVLASGGKRRQFSPAVDWERLPVGWSHRDVADVAVDAEDRVYVFNRGEHPVIVYSPEGEYLYSWGENTFSCPHGITIGPDGSVFCVDSSDHTVRKFSPSGRLLKTMGTVGVPSETGYRFGDSRSVQRAAGPFNRPTKLCVLSNGDFYVSDGYGNASIHHFSGDGRLRRSFGGPGAGAGEFHLPHAVAVAPDESRLYVADRENSRIELLDLDGNYLGEWTDVSRPDGLAVDRSGEVYVAELGVLAGRYDFTDSIQEGSPWSRCSIFGPTGELLARWGGPDPAVPGSFYAAHGIAIDSVGDLYVAEVTWSAGGKNGEAPAGSHTLQKFVRG